MNFMKFLLPILLLISCNLYAAPEFKHFFDYTDMAPTKQSDPSICRVHYNAKLKINDRKEEPAFKSNSWKLVMRRGLYKAEVDKTLSDLYWYFLGYSTQLDFVEENKDIFLARREFKHFDKWDEVFKKENGHYYIKGFELQDDGTLVKDNIIKHFSGLGKLIVLADFFGDADAGPYNYGVQENDSGLLLIDYDLEDGFQFDLQPDHNESRLDDELKNMSWYQQEKKEMLRKIAETDFSVIEKIIRKNMTVSCYDKNRWLFEKILRDPTAYPSWDRKWVKESLEKVNAADDRDCDVDWIVKQLQMRHQALREKFNRG